jgi:lipoprotein-anchoring transpeptidase ErfK/SrfK
MRAALGPFLVLAALAAGGASADKPRRPNDDWQQTLKLQVLLDRAHFSPGEIDGEAGSNTERALAAFQRQRSLPSAPLPTPETWQALGDGGAPPLLSYVLTSEDLAGPFEAIPDDMMEKARLPALSYASALEGLAERFHASPRLLERLNPGIVWDRVGETVMVPNVSRGPLPKAATVVVEQEGLAVWALAADGKPLSRYPASMGSEHDPLPLGPAAIKGVSRNPIFSYNPELFWDADPSHAKAKLPAGPNSPVGVVWIDLSLEHYGIHGTPEPAAVGKTQSHGCIRLTNWDAAELADLVGVGTPVELVQARQW